MSHPSKECDVFSHSQFVKQHVVLRAETQAAADLLNVSPDVIAVDVGRATGWRQETCNVVNVDVNMKCTYMQI